MDQKDNTKFKSGLLELGIELDEHQFRQYDQYYHLLVEWNRVMNLTAITEYEDVVTKHFLDSLSIVNIHRDWNEKYARVEIEAAGEIKEHKIEAENRNSVKETGDANRKHIVQERLLDLGSGAGFPGIPLKIAFPGLDITLVDSLNKRVNFLNEVIRQLGLTGICAIHARAEELGQKEDYRETYDYCVSRAVAKLHLLSEYCIPLIRKGGYFISYKSGKVEEEIEEAKFAIRVLGGGYEKTVSFFLPDSDVERSLVVIKKQGQTPKEYPRNYGKITKKPLITSNTKKQNNILSGKTKRGC